MNITHYILKNLLILQVSFSIITKLKAVVKIAALMSLPAWLVTEVAEWSVSNQHYIAGVLACIAIDHLLGSIKHAFKLNDFTFKKNALGLLAKLALCAGAAILFEIIHSTVKDVTFVYEYLQIVTRLTVVLYPAGSAFMNMSALTNGTFPPLGWLKKITTFNKDLDLTTLTKSGSADIKENKFTAPQDKTGSTGSL